MAGVAARTRVTVTDEDLIHVGPGSLAGSFLRRFWHPAYCGPDLPAGKAKPIRVLGEELTLYRGEGGQPHVVAFRCAHRGTQLSTGWVEGDAIRCHYHGWLYDQTGQCIAQPGEDPSFASKIKILSYPAREYLGLIFIYMGPDPVPALPSLPQLEQGHTVHVRMLTSECNYFQLIENNVDPNHVPFVHRRSHGRPYVELGGDIPPTKVNAVETTYGIDITRTDSDGGKVFFVMPTSHALKLSTRRANVGRWREHYSWRTPVDDQRTLWFTADAFRGEGRISGDGPQEVRSIPSYDPAPHATRALSGQEDVHDVERELYLAEPQSLPEGQRDHYLANYEDSVILLGQGVTPNRSLDHLGRSDTGVILLRRIYRREVQALADGSPVKEWQPPADATD